MVSDLLCEIHNKIALLTINRPQKHNAFNNALLTALQSALDEVLADPKVRVIILKANGKHFSAGADLQWMKSMVSLDEQQNLADALVLGKLMYSLYHSPKPIIAMIQGAAFGGGAGLAAACSIAIAADSARFCFSEVKLGLIPAVISPYVVKAIGERIAQMLFMSAEVFDAQRAMSYHLIHHCVKEEALFDFTLQYAEQISHNAPQAVLMSLELARHVSGTAINETLMQYTASLIARKRVSKEGQQGIQAFLNKEIPNWN